MEKQIMKFVLKFVLGAVLVALGAIAAFAQDPICDNNPQAPQCYVNQQQAKANQYGGQQPAQSADQINRDYEQLQRQTNEARLHRCEVQVQNEYQQCVQSGRISCTQRQCF
jgi:hypothetical protein